MQIKNEKEVVAGVRVLAREMARELNVEELQAVAGGTHIITNPGTPMGTGTHGHMPDMDEGDPYL